MDHEPIDQLTSDLVERIENLHIAYGVSLTRHREWVSASYVARLANVFESMQPNTKASILSMRDYKGGLEIIWKDQPTVAMRREVDHAWEHVGCENSDDNIHMYVVTTYANYA